MTGRLRSACSALLVALASTVASAAPPPPHVDVEVLGWQKAEAGHASLWAAIVLKPEAGWHTYWKNPGDAGLPTEVHWQLPPGWSAGPIQWPAPQRIVMGPLASYGYETTATLFVRFAPAAGWDHKSRVTIPSRVQWLACREQCIPESAEATLSFPATTDARVHQALAAALAALPDSQGVTHATAHVSAGQLVVTLDPAQPGQFFPDKEELVEPGDTPHVEVHGATVSWSARAGRAAAGIDALQVVTGVWVPERGRPIVVSAPVRD